MPSNLQKRIEDTNPQGAYSGGSGANPWTSWFGRQKAHIETTPYDTNDRSTWVLPEGLGGTNIMLANTLELMSFMADSWYTQEALPLQTTQKTGIEWSKFIFMPKFANLVPERGVARLVRSRKTSGRATFERRGLGLLLTHGFMNTPDGQESYRMNLRQIAQSVVETNNFGVIYAYLTADDYEKKWDKDHGTYRGDTLEKILEVDTFLWDIFKRKNGATILNDAISASMEKYRGKANMYIMPPKIGRYYTIVPANRTDYWLAGPKGPASIYDGIDATRQMSQLDGNVIYLTRTYDVEPSHSKHGRAIDILRFNAQIGEYHLAFDTRRRGDYTGYKSSWRDVQIYDEDNDNFTTLSLDWMLKHCNRFAPNGEVLHINDPTVAKHNPKFSRADQSKDAFHYVDAQKRLQSAAFMGNMEHLETSDVFEWVETLLGRIPDVVLPSDGSDGSNNSYAIWTNGVRALKDMEAISYDSDVDAWFKSLAEANPGTSVHDGSKRFRNLPPTIRSSTNEDGEKTGLKEFKPNAWGGLKLPAAAESMTLPPGFANYAGFKTIKQSVITGEFEKLGYNQTQGEDIAKFVDMLDRLVEALKRMLPGNPLINARYASSWWHKATAADTFFENLVSPHHRDPIFLSGGGASGSRPSGRGSGRGNSRIGAEGDEGEDGNNSSDEDLDLTKLAEELTNSIAPYRAAIKPYFANIRDFDASVTSEGEDSIDEDVRRRLDNLVSVIKLVEDEEWKSLEGDGSNEAKLQRLLDEAKAKGLLAYALQEAGALNDESKEAIAEFSATVIEPFVAIGEPIRMLRRSNDFANAFIKGYKALGGGSRSVNKKNGLKAILGSIKSIGDASNETTGRRGKNGPRSVVRARASALEFGLGASASDYKRAPLTMSPELFLTLHEFVKSGEKSVVWPSDPSNPDVTLSAVGFSERSDIENSNESDGSIGAPSLISAEVQRFQMGDIFEIDSFAAIRNLKQNSGIRRDSASKSSAPQYSNIGATFDDDEISTEFSSSSGRSNARNRRMGLKQTLAQRRNNSHGKRMASHYDDDMSTSTRRDVGRAQFASGVQSNMDDALTGKTDHFAFKRLMNDVYNEASHPLFGSLGALLLTTPTNKRNFSLFIKNHLLFPLDFIIARPHARFQTYAVIKAQKGSETGATFMGNSNFTLGDDPNTQIHVGTYTYYSKSVITEPRNVYVARNVFVDGYDGGLGTSPYKRGADTYNPRSNVYGSTKRRTDSVFVLAVPRGEKRYPKQIDLSGRFRSFNIRHYDLDTEDNGLHYAGAYFYNRYWGWSNEEIGLQASMPSSKYINEHAVPNSIMHEGHTLYFNPVCNNFNMVRISTGHYPSEFVYAGVKRAREGSMKEYVVRNWTNGYTNV